MNNFTYYNPVKIIFGKGTIPELSSLVPKEGKVLLTYGGGSIKRNGVYATVKAALERHDILEFGGIEANPEYDTLMQAVRYARNNNVKFLLAIGGGSVIDGTKFIASAMPFKGEDPWEIVLNSPELTSTLPIGVVLTLPATGSEANPTSVISRRAIKQKRAFRSPLLFPKFSILDPEVTYSLPPKQIRNGIVDSFLHVVEQYMVVRNDAPLQDRQAEAIISTLIEEGPRTLENPEDYTSRATLIWCASQALNGTLSCGIETDWSTHLVSHELTALYGLDHAEALAIVLPAMWNYKKKQKWSKLKQYAERVWKIRGGSEERAIIDSIEKTVAFFNSLGMPTTLTHYNIPKETPFLVEERLHERGIDGIGELCDITPEDVRKILELCW